MSSSNQQQPPLKAQPQPPSSTARTRSNNGPTISIENVELLEADRQHERKRSSRQEEAGPIFRTNPSSFVYGTYSEGAPPSQGYPAQQQQQPQVQQDPTQPSNYFYPNYAAAPAPAQQQQQAQAGFGGNTSPHYGMYQQPQPQPGAFYPPAAGAPYPYAAGGYPMQAHPPQQQQQQQQQQALQATEYTGIMSSSSGGGSGSSSLYEGGGGGGYGSIPASNHYDVTGSSNRGNGALTIDDIEKTFNSVVSQHFPEPPAPPAVSAQQGMNTGEPQRRASDGMLPGKPPAPVLEKKPSNAGSTINNPTHRRTGSESSQKHRRTPSGNLPPSGARASPANSVSNRKRPDNLRPRSYSGSHLSVGSGRELRRSFSREGSVTDLQSVGAQSVASRHSIVSDISKSGMFQGVTNEGHVQLHFPYEAVRLVANKDMEKDRLYMQEISAAEYENYHLVAEEATNWEHRMMDGYGGAKKDALPPAFYAVRLEEDVYRRIFDEIADSHQLPCKLFFLGHHEDISRPSVAIAGVVVVLLFFAMAYVAMMENA